MRSSHKKVPGRKTKNKCVCYADVKNTSAERKTANAFLKSGKFFIPFCAVF